MALWQYMLSKQAITVDFQKASLQSIYHSVDFDTWGIDSESILGGIDKESAESILIDTGIDSFAYTWPDKAKIDSFTDFWYYFLFFTFVRRFFTSLYRIWLLMQVPSLLYSLPLKNQVVASLQNGEV